MVRLSAKTNIPARLRRGVIHLRNGTLSDRLQQEWRHYVGRKRKRWWKSRAGKREYVDARIESGIVMRLYRDGKLSELIYCHDFERQERDFLKAFLKPGDLFVDVGANIGLFTLIAAKYVGDRGRVYAFEPCLKTYRHLLANVRLNGLQNVSPQKAALSDETAERHMNVSLRGYDAWNSLARPIDGRNFSTEMVTCITWDDFAQEHDLIGRVTMMKIDVEGWENHVLAGGYQNLSRADAPILQVEFTEQTAESAGSSCAELYRALEELGYQMFMFDKKSKRLIRDPLRDSYPYINLIAAKHPDKVVSRLGERRASIHRMFLNIFE